MITINTLYTIQIYQGLSTDTKPADNVPNGSIFIEMDTAKKYRFDKENEIWLDYDNPQPEGGDEMFIVTITASGGEDYVADKSFEEILAAYEDGKTIAAITEVTGVATIHYLSTINPEGEYAGVDFESLPIINDDTGVSNTGIFIAADDSVTVTSYNYVAGS